MSPFRFRLLQALRHQQPKRGEQGFSLALAVVTLMTLLMGGLILASRSGQSLLGTGFLQQSWAARDAAEIGMTRIISELNKPQNRMLMVKRGNTPDNDNFLWSASDKTSSFSNCPGTEDPDIQSNPSLGNNGSFSYAEVFLSEDGNFLSSQAGAAKSYRLIEAKRELKTKLQDFKWPDSEGIFQLKVEGKAYRNGSIVAAVQLKKEFSLVPKCCNASFGGDFGNDNYSASWDSANSTWDATSSSCYDKRLLGLGLLSGNNTGTGSINLNGTSNTITADGTLAQPVEPIYCVAGLTSSCTIDGETININNSKESGGVNIEVIDFQMPSAPTYPVSPLPSPKPLEKPGRINSPDNTQFKYCVAEDTTLTPPICKDWIIDARVTSFDAVKDPPCVRKVLTIPPSTNTASSRNVNETHCYLSKFSYQDSNSVTVLTNSDNRIRFYFPEKSVSAQDYVVDGGNRMLKHCDASSTWPNCEPSKNITNFAMFGCNIGTTGCGTQYVDIFGGSEALGFFAYFPQGSFRFSGTTNFKGILWSNEINVNGDITMTVPGSGLVDAFILIRLLNGESDKITDKDTGVLNSIGTPFIFDVVARATNSFKWLGF